MSALASASLNADHLIADQLTADYPTAEQKDSQDELETLDVTSPFQFDTLLGTGREAKDCDEDENPNRLRRTYSIAKPWEGEIQTQKELNTLSEVAQNNLKAFDDKPESPVTLTLKKECKNTLENAKKGLKRAHEHLEEESDKKRKTQPPPSPVEEITPVDDVSFLEEEEEEEESDLITTRKVRRLHKNVTWELQKKLWTKENTSRTYYFPPQKYEKTVTGTVKVCDLLCGIVEELKSYKGDTANPKFVNFTICETDEYDAMYNGKSTMGVVSFHKHVPETDAEAEPKYETTLISGPSGSGKTTFVNHLIERNLKLDEVMIFDDFDPLCLQRNHGMQPDHGMGIAEFIRVLKRETMVNDKGKPRLIFICSLKSMEQIVEDISNKYCSTYADEFKKLVTNCVTLSNQKQSS
mgnify:CR=1 FL=1